MSWPPPPIQLPPSLTEPPLDLAPAFLRGVLWSGGLMLRSAVYYLLGRLAWRLLAPLIGWSP